MSASSWIHLDVQVIRRETEAAFNVILKNGRIYWIPKSQISDAGYYEAGDRNLTLSVSQWFAKKEGLAEG